MIVTVPAGAAAGDVFRRAWKPNKDLTGDQSKADEEAQAALRRSSIAVGADGRLLDGEGDEVQASTLEADQLSQLLRERGLACEGCVEKSEFVDMLQVRADGRMDRWMDGSRARVALLQPAGRLVGAFVAHGWHRHGGA